MHDLPLDGVVVVELSDSASAPFAGQILAALGADVWKVERPTGDSARGWGPSKWKGSGAAFHAINRGKRFISHDVLQHQAKPLRRLKMQLIAKLRLQPLTAGWHGAGPLAIEKQPIPFRIIISTS